MATGVAERHETSRTPAASGLTRTDRRSLGRMALVIVALHVIGIGVLVALVAPRHFALGGSTPVFSVGVGVLAYTFGLRHAFDADHIAAIDNTTRRLMADPRERGRRPLSVGFWFSLGHSSVVFALSLLLSFGMRALAGQVTDGGSRLHALTAVVGAAVSGIFLWAIGLMNLGALGGLVSVFRGMRRGRFDEAELERHLDSRGFLNRFLGRLTRSVTRPWHIYPIGVLFGLGFDTATEVGLLVLAGGAAAFSLPFYAILVLPVLFAAGMALADTVDGVLMTGAYGWAFRHPVRTVFYNLTITSLSVAVALGIGSIELAGVLADRAHLTSGPLAALGSVPLDHAGYWIVGLFLTAWLVAVLVWKLGRVEQRWSEGLRNPS